MEIRIGIRDSNKEISIDVSLSEEAVTELVEKAIADGAPTLKFKNDKGGSVLIPTSSLGYVEFPTSEERRVGFIA
jgi:DNA-binding Lrp family transcriptional regulator